MTRPESWQQSSPHMECTVEKQGQQYVVTYSLNAGINKFGKQAKASAHKEMKELHDRSCFRPVHKYSLNKSERQRVLLFLTEKRDKTIKSQHCANGSTQCVYKECDEVASPTISVDNLCEIDRIYCDHSN